MGIKRFGPNHQGFWWVSIRAGADDGRRWRALAAVIRGGTESGLDHVGDAVALDGGVREARQIPATSEAAAAVRGGEV